MQIQFSLGTSQDGKLAKISFAKGAPANWTMTAQDIEALIDSLSNARGKMLPLVRQYESPLSVQAPMVDDIGPRTDFARCPDGQVLVSVAFRGLGWRTFQLEPDDARQLAKDLISAAGTASE